MCHFLGTYLTPLSLVTQGILTYTNEIYICVCIVRLRSLETHSHALDNVTHIHFYTCSRYVYYAWFIIDLDTCLNPCTPVGTIP